MNCRYRSLARTYVRAIHALPASNRMKCQPRHFTSSSQKSSLIGFIGLGNMGLPMCQNLLNNDNHQVFVYDTNPISVKKITADHSDQAKKVSTVGDIGAAGCDVVISSLPSCKAVESVYSELLEGIATSGQRDHSTVYVDCSTVSPSISRSVHDQIVKAGHLHVDAPVSGGVVGAANATLTFMAGSDPLALELATPFLNCMGKNIIHCGGSGTGSATKLCNNLALSAQMAGICEAMNLGEALGVDPVVLADVMNASTAKCWSCEVNNPHPEVAKVRGMTAAANDYNGGFASKLMLKDVALALDAAQNEEVAVPVGASIKKLYQMIEKRGLAEKDFGVLLQFLKGK